MPQLDDTLPADLVDVFEEHMARSVNGVQRAREFVEELAAMRRRNLAHAFGLLGILLDDERDEEFVENVVRVVTQARLPIDVDHLTGPEVRHIARWCERVAFVDPSAAVEPYRVDWAFEARRLGFETAELVALAKHYADKWNVPLDHWRVVAAALVTADDGALGH